MIKYCLLLITVLASWYDDYKPLDLEFIKTQTTILMRIPRTELIESIKVVKKKLKKLMNEYEDIMDDAETVEEGRAQWAEKWESGYAAEFDKGILEAYFCRKHYNMPECDSGVGWWNLYDTRDKALRDPFLAGVDKAVIEGMNNVRSSDL